MRVLVTAETFTLSSNIIMDTSTFLLRYALPAPAHFPSQSKRGSSCHFPGSCLPAVCPQARLWAFLSIRVMVPPSGVRVASTFLEVN